MAAVYRAHETRSNLQTRLGLVPCFTPVRSPESNGIAEAFVKNLQARLRLRSHDRPDALKQSCPSCRCWFEDYNESCPYKGLQMKIHPVDLSAAYQPATCPV